MGQHQRLLQRTVACRSARAARPDVRLLHEHLRFLRKRPGNNGGAKAFIFRKLSGSTAKKNCPTTSPPKCATCTCCATRGTNAPPNFAHYAETKQPHNSRWNWIDKGHWDDGHWIVPDKSKGPFGHTTHILASTARIALLYWSRYEYTMDEDWLRQRTYPMLKGTVEFYRNFPNMQKGDDGKYHLYHVNNGEPTWNVTDPPMEMVALHRLLPTAIRASEILDTDKDLRHLWQEFNDNLAPLRDGATRRAGSMFTVSGSFGGRSISALAQLPEDQRGQEMLLSLIEQPEQGERSFVDSAGSGHAGILPNRMRLREGPGAIDCEHLGGLCSRLHGVLLQRVAADDKSEPALQLFPQWPRAWDAEYTLLAPGDFLVSASMKNGQIDLMQIRSEHGGRCSLQNPWEGKKITVLRDGKPVKDIEGGRVIPLDTKKGEVIKIALAESN